MRAAPPEPPTPPLRHSAAGRLAARYAGTFGRETVERCLGESHALLAARARITHYLPVLAERFADRRLAALARAEGLAPKPVPEVLFVCTENAGRSQLAAALLHRTAGTGVLVHTAGTRPAPTMDPVTTLAQCHRR